MSDVSEFTAGRVREALNDFILRFCQPQFEQRQVIGGRQNNNSLPKGTNEFVIVTPLLREQRGTTIEAFAAEPGAALGRMALSEMRLEDVQLDFYGPAAAERASAISALAGTNTANKFLEGFGAALTHADPVRALAAINASRQYTNRHSITVHLCLWGELTIDAEYFNELEISNSEVIR